MSTISGEANSLKRLRAICLGIPDAVETSSWGHANWRVGKKLFATFEETPRGITLSIFVGLERRDELLRETRFFLPRYTDHHGWICMAIDRKTDWADVRRLILRSHALATAQEQES